MYAVVEQGGKQYKVSEGDTLQIELVDIAEDAQTFEFEKVLMVGEGADAKIGTPTVDGAKVVGRFATTAGDAMVGGPKLYPMHFRRRKDSKRRVGHRQKYLELTIESISA